MVAFLLISCKMVVYAFKTKLLLEEFNEESCLLQRTFNFRMFSKKSKRFVSKVCRRHRRECLRHNINYFRYRSSLLDYQM